MAKSKYGRQLQMSLPRVRAGGAKFQSSRKYGTMILPEPDPNQPGLDISGGSTYKSYNVD